MSDIKKQYQKLQQEHNKLEKLLEENEDKRHSLIASDCNIEPSDVQYVCDMDKCEKSPAGYCVYVYGEQDIFCTYCNHPEEQL